MRHIRTVSAKHPRPADEISTISSLIDLLTAIVGLIGDIHAVFGISSYLDKKNA
jgi:hypothetical protein